MEKKMRSKLILMFVALFAFAFILIACGNDEVVDSDDNEPEVTNNGGDDGDNGDDNGDEDPVDDDEDFDSFAALNAAIERANVGLEVVNNDPIIEDGILRFAFGMAGELQPIYESVFWRFSTENEIRRFTHEPLLFVGTDFNPSNVNSLATATYDREARTVTITKNHESVWADGVPLTLADLVFAYEVISHPDYTGTRWDANMRNVVGTEAFRDGEADSISGLTLSEDEMELTIEFHEMNPFTFAFGYWTSPMPRHHWEGIEVADMPEHENARINVLGNGPFKIQSGAPGESLHLVRNDNFWRGQANLAEVIIEVVDPMMAPEVMRTGMYDIINFPQSLFTEENRQLDNIQFLSNPWNGNATWWLGFRMGDFDEASGEVVPWAEPRLSQTVRTALALSMNHEGAGLHLFNGLVVPSGSRYWPLNRRDWIDSSIETYNTFDIERAKQMLDDAGYTMGPDGFRTRPDGSELTVVYAAQTGSEANINNRQLELDNWRDDLGINVVLYQDRLVDSSVFWDAIELPISNEIDMFTFGVGFGANPAPTFCCDVTSTSNHVRYTSPHWQYVQSRFNSDEMWNEAFVLETVNMWERAVADTYMMFPTTTAIGLTAVNNRVANFSLVNNGENNAEPNFWNTWLWGVTAAEAYVAN